MPNVRQLLERALAHQRKGQLAQAERLYQQVLEIDPRQFDALHLLGAIRHRQGRHEQALELIGKALEANPNSVEALSRQALVLAALNRPEQALASYDRALALKPTNPVVLFNRGNALRDLNRLEEALESFDRALALKPNYAKALVNRGVVLNRLNWFPQALGSFDRAIVLGPPDEAEAHYNRATTLFALNRFEEAVAAYDSALERKPELAEALNNRGMALSKLRRFDAALASYQQALAVRPGFAEALNNRALALAELHRFEEALASCDEALDANPDFAEAWANRGNILRRLRQLDLASEAFDKALALAPGHPLAFAGMAAAALFACDWRRTAAVAEELRGRVREGRPLPSPFRLLGYSDDSDLHAQCARRFTAEHVFRGPPLWNGEIFRTEKIRLAYLSADFHEHATAYLMAELFERHDRARFETIALSYGFDDGSEMRARLHRAFDRFHDVRAMSDRQAAELLRGLDVAIAVDLKGHTRDSRPGILAHRPAPIQVNYLGYPGTMGADFIDYIMADPIVVPFDRQRHYTEKIVHLPDCYQPNDSRRQFAEPPPSREQAGLPPRGFVFSCFNSSYKIAPPVFDIWMRLVGEIEGSVLWLLWDNEAAERNLCREAQIRGVEPSRLVFARKVKLADHLARSRLADLFLDTLPYNAHTTASDALWAGVPLVTCQGEAFAGRVAASLLHAIGLPEMVTHSLEDYERLVRRLAREPGLLNGFRARLARNRLTHPLFDTTRSARHIEAAYTAMWEIWQRGEAARSFAVAPISPIS
jgi:predicted O-linked N-acetylglucosamine transferase (SPINDLY family)